MGSRCVWSPTCNKWGAPLPCFCLSDQHPIPSCSACKQPLKNVYFGGDHNSGKEFRLQGNKVAESTASAKPWVSWHLHNFPTSTPPSPKPTASSWPFSEYCRLNTPSLSMWYGYVRSTSTFPNGPVPSSPEKVNNMLFLHDLMLFCNLDVYNFSDNISLLLVTSVQCGKLCFENSPFAMALPASMAASSRLLAIFSRVSYNCMEAAALLHGSFRKRKKNQ